MSDQNPTVKDIINLVHKDKKVYKLLCDKKLGIGDYVKVNDILYQVVSVQEKEDDFEIGMCRCND